MEVYAIAALHQAFAARHKVWLAGLQQGISEDLPRLAWRVEVVVSAPHWTILKVTIDACSEGGPNRVYTNCDLV